MTRDQVKTVSWNTVKTVAAAAGSIVFAIGFMMTVLGWRFVGNADDIKLNTGRITSLEVRLAPVEEQNKATLFMLCPIYRKQFPGAPVPPVCPRSDP